MVFGDSSIDPGVAAERGTFTAQRGKDVPQEHGKLPAKPGMVFPVHTLDGGIFHRLRPDNPGGGGKYFQPTGAPNRLDVHPRQHDRIKLPGGIRYVTEGERKVDAGVSRGLLMVGMSGVWNGQKDKELIPDWDLLPLEGEDYSITFDSDIETNEHVQLAADRMARLLKARGANVFITLLPPAPDGGKQGLDDFFANGGTVKEFDLLTRAYEPLVIERARLSRDERLRLAMEDLERRFWGFEWKGMGGYSARDVFLKLIEAARRHGEVVGDGVRVVKAQGPLALEAKVSARTLWKSLNRLEEWGLLYRDNEGRQRDIAGAFVLRASVSQYGRSDASEGQATRPLQGGVPGDLHLRAPCLMWSRPKYTPKRGTVRGTRKVRQGPPPEARAAIKRLGKVRKAIIDALDQRGRMHINELAGALQRKRARDIRRRLLPMLEEAEIITVDGDTVSLTADWLDRLEEARRIGGEIEAERDARRRYLDKSRAYHKRRETKPDHHYVNVGADGWIEDLLPADAPEPELSPLAAAMRTYLERNPHDAKQPPSWLGLTLWAHDFCDGKPTPEESRAALEELGTKRKRRAA
jgi:DNA-binding HxlR family transcriptional regulator